MESKIFELRAEATLKVILAIKLSSINNKEKALLAHSGFGNSNLEVEKYFLCIAIDAGKDNDAATTDCYEHKYNEMVIAHKFINKHFDDLRTGDVIDVDFISGRHTFCKESDFNYNALESLFSKWNDNDEGDEHDDC
jgi:hypothetical protein